MIEEQLPAQAIWPARFQIQDLLERLPAAAGVVEQLESDLVLLWVNPAAAQAFGGSAKDLTNKRFSALSTVRASLPKLLERYRAASRSRQPVQFEQQLEHFAATLAQSTTIVPLEGPRFFFISEDVTRRTSLEQLLRAGEAKYRAVFAGAREAIALFNLDTLRCVEANDAFVTIYGWTKQELREVTLRQLGNPGDAEKAAKECLAQGSLRLSAPLNQRADRTAFPAECDVHLLQLGERRVLCLISHDLTAQRRLQESLLLADRFAAVGTLAAGVSHEINNPLSYLLANLTFVAERLPELRGGAGVEQSISELQPALREAIIGAQRVREIVRDLSTFSRPELPDGVPLELNPLLESVLRLVQAEVKLRATLVREIAPLPLPLVIGHEPRFAQVMLNLLNNALEAFEAIPGRGPAQNLLRVAAYTANDEVRIEIEDNGPGLTAEQQRRAFDPFFTTRTVGHGSGLGLSVCHGIVTAMGGRIELKSVVSRGTTVRVLLPIAPSGRPVGKVRPASDPGRIAMPTLPRMLVIDDEPMLTDAIRRMLLGEAEVTPLTTVDEAIALLAAGEKYDAILCDLHLAGKSGMDFHDELSRSMPAVAARLGFITGGAIDEASQTFVRKHSDRVLEKPFSRNGLRALVKSLVAAP